MHLVDNADFVHTFADIVQTQSRQYAEYHTPVRLAHFSVVISCEFNYRALGFAGPTWRQRDGSVLVASRRFDGSRSRKTKGSLADTLQCNIWRRAQTPHLMTHSLHSGTNHGNDNGFTALGKANGTPKSACIQRKAQSALQKSSSAADAARGAACGFQVRRKR